VGPDPYIGRYRTAWAVCPGWPSRWSLLLAGFAATLDPQRTEQQLREAGTYFDFTWALVLNELPGQRARLLVRTRANYSPRAFRFLTLPLGLFDATYGVAQLRAIARRAEDTGLAGM
jgi:hypothetical protein